MNNVCAVIVTYNPIWPIVKKAVDALSGQVSKIIVVNNGSSLNGGQIKSLKQGLILIQNTENKGVAFAINQGISRAITEKFKYVLLLDDDSVPQAHMVSYLLGAMAKCRERSLKIAAAGPILVDPRTNTSSRFIRFGWLWNHHMHCSGADTILFPDFLISSGALIPTESYKDIGPMNEGLFIDNVDMEWCFRAKALGYNLLGVCNTSMTHTVGDAVINMGNVIQIKRHRPIRQYYIIRNRILLYKKRVTPKKWIIQDLIRIPFKIIIYPLIFWQQSSNLRMTIYGIVDGILGRSGAFEDNHSVNKQ